MNNETLNNETLGNETLGSETISSDIEPIWHEFQQRLRAYLASRVKTSADIDDLLQEVFIKVYKNLDKLRDQQRLSAWLFQITRNVLTDYYRAKPRLEISSIMDTEAHSVFTDTLPEHQATAKLAEQELAGCLQPLTTSLAEKYQTAIQLSELDGLRQIDAAQKLGISVSAMKSRVQRGRQQLQTLLKDCCAVEQDIRGRINDYHGKQQNCGTGGKPTDEPGCC